jgi:hypothetical protein
MFQYTLEKILRRNKELKNTKNLGKLFHFSYITEERERRQQQQ